MEVVSCLMTEVIFGAQEDSTYAGAALVAESYEPGAMVGGVARRHGIVAAQFPRSLWWSRYPYPLMVTRTL